MARATLRRAAAWWRRQLDDAAPGARRALAIILGAGAVAAALAAILGLVFMFVPGLGPESRATAVTVPLGGSADLEVTLRRVTMMTRRAFYTREGIPPDGVDANELAKHGVAVDFDATAAGFDGLMTLPVVLTLFKQQDDDLQMISSLVGQVDLTGGIGLCGCAEWVDVPRIKAEFLVAIGVGSPEIKKAFRRAYSEPFFGLA